MPASTTLHFLIPGKCGNASLRGKSVTSLFKRVIVQYANKIETLSGWGADKALTQTPADDNVWMENTRGVYMTVTVMMPEFHINGVPAGFFTPLVLEGKINKPLKSPASYYITCYNPVSNAIECRLELTVQNFSELSLIPG